jgi:glycosyltransferase involved in cell wall biosynthesis
MRIGVWKAKNPATSVQIYTEQVVKGLESFGHQIVFFGQADAVPEVDIIWDPSCTGARYPNRKILQTDIPWIVTLHGASNLSMPLKYNFPTFGSQLKGVLINLRRRLMWSWYKYKVAHVITVSAYAKEEIVQELGIYPTQISVIYHGYDDVLFHKQSGEKSYLLHVSVYQSKKNVEAVVEAYRGIREPRWPLVIVCPGFPAPVTDSNITIHTTPMNRKQVAGYMKEAYAFIFPSLHESFGMPLVEAMACGVPLITSNTTACPEIMGDAGMAVDPLSVADIRHAMEKIMNDSALHDALVQKALLRAKDFSWEKTARLHETIFRRYTE